MPLGRLAIGFHAQWLSLCDDIDDRMVFHRSVHFLTFSRPILTRTETSVSWEMLAFGIRLMDNSVRSEQVNVIALVRGEEHYVFVFDPKRRTELLRLLGRYAADPTMSFNWYDAAVLSQKIRDLMPATEFIDPPATAKVESNDRSRRF